jgi:hypothetical protein
MRNGDYFPSRMEAQIDAVNVVMGWKFQSNPENTVGVLKMAKGYVLIYPSPCGTAIARQPRLIIESATSQTRGLGDPWP